jgi:hypothetical protein
MEDHAHFLIQVPPTMALARGTPLPPFYFPILPRVHFENENVRLEVLVALNELRSPLAGATTIKRD